MAHLEEKLNAARSAAQAAAAASAAQSTITPVSIGISENISPQALRESLLVLQEQLHERESRIEELEHQASLVDSDAPKKLKERDVEIGWLRELLGLRVDELTELVHVLLRPNFDRTAVRDAAIRIKTNLEMEIQEKDRRSNGSSAFSSLSTLSNFAAPIAPQLAAALGTWGKLKESARAASNSSRVSQHRRGSPSISSSYASGLMTPPASNLRRTPQVPDELGFTNINTPKHKQNRGSGDSHSGSIRPLLRSADYDQDADDGEYSTGSYHGDDGSTVDGNPRE